MAVNIAVYYSILGVNENASPEDIKKAYRTKAKLLHPDKNDSPDAHENFVLLNEAHEYLLNLKTVGHQTSDNYDENYDDLRQSARERGHEYARMRYEEFTQTDKYKSVLSFATIVYHLGFFLSLALLIILPIGAYIKFGSWGLGWAFIIMLVTSPITVNAIRDSPPLNLGAFFNAIHYMLQERIFWTIALSITNIFIFMKLGLQTLISPYWLLDLIGVSILITYFLKKTKNKHDKFKLAFQCLCIAPLVINFIILLNFMMSNSPVKETYHFQNDTQTARRRGGTQESTYIFLDNEAYNDYPGIRMFFDYEAMRYKKHVTYTFKKGLLGFRVMTAFEFNP